VTTNYESFAKANPNTLADHLRKMGIARVMSAQVPQAVQKVDPAADPYQLATVESVGLPAFARASSILRATVRAGGVTGELTPVAFGVTPATTQIGVAPNGEIVVLAADLITDMDVTFVPESGEVYDLPEIEVATHVATLPTFVTSRGVALLIEAEALTGTATGKKIILIPGAGAPAAGQARLNIAKSTVTFAVADAVTKARLKLLIVPEKQLLAYMSESATTL
jgi:hypothetical protein